MLCKKKVFLEISQNLQENACVKKMFLEISQNSLENTCARVSFLKKTLALVFSCKFYEYS